MSLAKQKPLFDPPIDYEDDFHDWSYQQAELLRQRRFAEVDLPNVIEELESMGGRTASCAGVELQPSHLPPPEMAVSERDAVTVLEPDDRAGAWEHRRPRGSKPILEG